MRKQIQRGWVIYPGHPADTLWRLDLNPGLSDFSTRMFSYSKAVCNLRYWNPQLILVYSFCVSQQDSLSDRFICAFIKYLWNSCIILHSGDALENRIDIVPAIMDLMETVRNISVVIYCGVHSPWDLMPDDLRWIWCNNNRNKVHNKCNELESPPKHPLPPSMEKLSSMKLVPGEEGALWGGVTWSGRGGEGPLWSKWSLDDKGCAGLSLGKGVETISHREHSTYKGPGAGESR